MRGEQLPGFTDVDVRSLAAKLKGLHAFLTPSEQALLDLVLQRAAGSLESPAHLDGVAWSVRFNPFPYLDALLSGRGPRPGGRAAADCCLPRDRSRSH